MSLSASDFLTAAGEQLSMNILDHHLDTNISELGITNTGAFITSVTIGMALPVTVVTKALPVLVTLRDVFSLIKEVQVSHN